MSGSGRFRTQVLINVATAIVVSALTLGGAYVFNGLKIGLDHAGEVAVASSLANDHRFANLVAKLRSVTAWPIGAVVAWPTTKDVPPGWRRCNGDLVSESDFPELASLLKGIHGEDPPGLFRLPDYRGLFLRGSGGEAGSVGAAQEAAVDLSDAGFVHEVYGELKVVPEPCSYEHGSLRFLALTAVELTPPGKRDSAELSFSPRIADTRPANRAVEWIIRVSF